MVLIVCNSVICTNTFNIIAILTIFLIVVTCGYIQQHCIGGFSQFIKVLSTILLYIIYSQLYHIVEYIYITELDYCIDL